MTSEASQKSTYRAKNLITESLVRAVLSYDMGQGVYLSSWSVEDFIKKGDSYASVITSIRVCYITGDGTIKEVSYIAKLSPGSTLEFYSSFINNMFKKEGMFYLNIVPQINAILRSVGQPGLRVPRCLYIDYTLGNEVLILEDLRSQGFRTFDRRKPMDIYHTNLVMKELGRLHAASLLLNSASARHILEIYPLLRDLWMNNSSPERASWKSMMSGGLHNAIQLVRHCEGYELVGDWLETLQPNMLDIMVNQLELTDDQTPVLCHGDTWAGNLLFRYDRLGLPVDVKLVDWQCCRWAPLASEINYFMCTSLAGHFRRKNYQDLLHTYRDSLDTLLGHAGYHHPVDYKDLQNQMSMNIFGLMTSLILLPVVVLEMPDDGQIWTDDGDQQEENKVEVLERMRQQQDVALGALSYNSLLRPRFLDLLDDCVDRGLLETSVLPEN